MTANGGHKADFPPFLASPLTFRFSTFTPRLDAVPSTDIGPRYVCNFNFFLRFVPGRNSSKHTAAGVFEWFCPTRRA